MSQRAAHLVGWAAAACWLASWFLPVIDGYPGWAAFHAALTGPFREAFPTRGGDAAIQLLSAFTNAGFAILFAHWYLGRITRPMLFMKLALLCLLIDLYWLVEMLRAGEHGELLAGYYLWLASFALLVALGAFNVVSARRTSKTPTADTPA